MLRSDHLPSPNRRAVWLLACGLLAIALRVLAAGDLVRAPITGGGGGKFVVTVCTSHGLVQMPLDQAPPVGGAHDCCKLCAGGGPLMLSSLPVGVPPAPTFAAPPAVAAVAPPPLAMHTVHAPRGPPTRA